MNKLPLVLLVCAVAIAAFLLGQRNASVPSGQETLAVSPPPASGSTEPAPAAGEPNITAAAPRVGSSEPTRTFRGPDGRPQLISYELDKPEDSTDPVAVKEGLLSDMAHHPRNITNAYGLTEAEIAAILAGTRPFPDALLPRVDAAKTKR